MFFRVTNLCLLAVLSGCVAQGPVLPNEPSGGNSQSKPGSASTDGRTAVVTPPLPAKTKVTSAEALVKFDDPEFARNPALTVDKRCFDFARSEAASDNGLFKMVYVAGDCDSNGKANGMGIVSLTGSRNGNGAPFLEGRQAEGLFKNGMFVPSMKYHIYGTFPGRNVIKASAFSCSEMVPSGDTFGADSTVFYGSDKTECKEIVDGKRMRILKASSSRAIKLGRSLDVVAPVKCQGVYFATSFRSKSMISSVFDGTCIAASEDTYNVTGSFLVKMLGDTFEKNGDLLRLLNGQSSNVVAPYVGGLVGVTFVSNDGTQFTPSGANSYELFLFPDRLKGAQGGKPFKVLTFGESVFIKPLEGKIKYPDGRTYTGRFLNGEPIFN